MKDEALADVVEANYAESFALLAQACGGRVLEMEDALAIATGLPVAALNHGFVRRPLPDPQRTLGEITGFFEAAGLPFVVRIREGVDTHSESIAAALGMPYTDTVPGMALNPIPRPPGLPSDIEIKVVRDEAALAGYQRVAAAGFGMPLRLTKRLLSAALLEIPGLESYIGIVRGKPVATATAYMRNGTVGIYNVATLPSHRRRGFGEAMTWHAISCGVENGCTVAILQASAMGEPVYTRMGFRNVAPHKTFQRRGEEGS